MLSQTAPAETGSHAERLAALRARMKKQGLAAFLVPRTDRFQSEYPAPCDERLRWLTGFTGSAGLAIVTPEKTVVLTDGRYTIQVKQQIDGSLFETGDSAKIKPEDWIAQNVSKGVVGYDPWLLTAMQAEKLETALKEKKLTLQAVKENPIDAVWDDRPPEPCAPAGIFPEEIAGKSVSEKCREIGEKIKEQGACAAFISLPDSICWLLNIRGSDVDYSPLMLSYAIVYADGKVDLFVQPEKITPEMKVHFGDIVNVVEFSRLEKLLKELARKSRKQPVLVDFQRTAVRIKTLLEEAGAAVKNFKDPCIAPKASKNKAEQAGIEQAHVRDGAAIVKFLRWLEEEAPKGGLDELKVEEKLESFRRENNHYRGPSFSIIAGFGPNGAIVHYRATPATNLKLKAPGILLLDSGGQYRDGTTDITRTIAIGDPAPEMRRHYTLVLKGHIALARARFPEGTTGAQLDALARQPLWQAGLDYAHGTGHGVGCYLQVHEEAASISPRGKDSVKAGMLLSNEPGYYKEGSYGIRIENLVLAEEAGICESTGAKMLGFKTVTLAPLDKKLIDVSLLNPEERAWVDAYHVRVASALLPHLDNGATAWLKAQARPL